MLPFSLKIRKKRLKSIYKSDGPRGIFKMSLVGEGTTFKLRLPKALVAVFTDGSEERQDLEIVPHKATKQVCEKKLNFPRKP